MDGKKILIAALQIFLFIFGLIIIYQIIRNISGGSQDAESIIASLVFLNLSATITLTVMMAGFRSDLYSLRGQFNSSAGDFKRHISDSTAHKK